MKIGLIRHFKVEQDLPNSFLINYETLTEWFEKYNNAAIKKHEVDIRKGNWQICYTSSLSRAYNTAQHIFKGEIIVNDALKEVDVLSLMNKNLKLPIIFWAILIKNKTLSANIITEQSKTQLSSFVDSILQNAEKEVLIVSHGFIMMLLQKELLARGFRGDKFRNPANGKLYVFENNN